VSLHGDIGRVLAEYDALADREHATERLLAIFEVYAKALAHPLRGQILTLLEDGGRKSPSELAGELEGAPLGNVSYHVRYLHGQDLIRLVATEPRRGAVEHFYEAR
jgi:DNA-binding transcriptional ArsR family regulator